MELILWRHAEAKDGEPDIARPLTRKGRSDAARMALWLNAHLPEDCSILVSPAVRTIQTAETLGRTFQVQDALMPGARPEDVLRVADWPDGRKSVLVVGHQPTLGQVASLLVAGVRQDWRIRRSAVWWISRREQDNGFSVLVRAVVDPDMVQIR